jgi:hypothetical protein
MMSQDMPDEFKLDYELRKKPRIAAKKKLMVDVPPHTCGGLGRPENGGNIIECVTCEMEECPGAHPEHGNDDGCPLCHCEPDVDHPWTPLELALKEEVDGLSVALQNMEDRLLGYEMTDSPRREGWRCMECGITFNPDVEYCPNCLSPEASLQIRAQASPQFEEAAAALRKAVHHLEIGDAEALSQLENLFSSPVYHQGGEGDQIDAMKHINEFLSSIGLKSPDYLPPDEN